MENEHRHKFSIDTHQIVMKIDSLMQISVAWKNFFFCKNGKHNDMTSVILADIQRKVRKEFVYHHKYLSFNSVTYPFQDKLTLFPLDLINDSIISL